MLQVKVDFSGTSNFPNNFDILNSNDVTNTGVLLTGLTDWDTSSTTGIDLEVTSAFMDQIGNTGWADSDHHGWALRAWENCWRPPNSPLTPSVFRIYGPEIVVGESYRVRIAGYTADFGSSSPDRLMEYEVNGVTGQYDQTYQLDNPNPPTELTVTATDHGDGNGELEFTVRTADGNDSYAAITAFEVLEDVPYITSITDSTDSSNDQITDGNNATIEFSESVTVDSVQLQNADGSFVADLAIQSSTSNSVTVLGSRGELRYGDSDNKVVATLSDASTVEYEGITLASPSTVYWINGSAPNTSVSNSAFYNAITPPTGDYQLIWEDPNDVGGTSSDASGDQSSSLFQSDGKNNTITRPGDIPLKCWDATDGTTSSEKTFTASLTNIIEFKNVIAKYGTNKVNGRYVAAGVPVENFGDSTFGGNIYNGIITIETDGSVDFGSKPTGPKPLLVWRGDDGIDPNGNLGRLSAWSKAPSSSTGTLTSSIAGPGSSQSATMDHHDSVGGFMGRTDINSDEAYIFRRTYNDFIEEDVGMIRTRLSLDDYTGEFQVGETVEGETSGVTGVIFSIEPDNENRFSVFYEHNQGTVSTDGYLVGQNFDYQENMVGLTSGASATNVEGSASSPTGTLRDFNNKIQRNWNDADRNNIFSGEGTGAKVTAEGTDASTHNVGDFDNPSVADHESFTWINDEFLYKLGSLNTRDGIYWWYKDGIKAYESRRFIMIDDEHPNGYDQVFHHQVSNGCMPGANRYMDLIYIDEDWCRVVLMDGPDIRLDLNEGTAIERKIIPCPIISWSGQKIESHDFRQYLPTATHIAAINSQNQVVSIATLPGV